MKLERIVHKIGTAALGGLLGITALTASAVPAYSQYKEKTISNVENVYIPCTPQQTARSSSMSAGESLTVLGLFLGMSKPNNPDAQNAGAILSTLGAMEHQKEVAREGRSEVNINQSQQREQDNRLVRYFPAPGCSWINPENSDDLSVKPIWRMAFAANYLKDFDKDGSLTRDEFTGIKDKFYDNEPIILVLLHPENKRISKKDINFELYYLPTGEKILEDSWKKSNYGTVCIGGTPPIGNEWTKGLSIKYGYGEYLAVFRSDGNSEKTKFEIVPASKRLEKRQ